VSGPVTHPGLSSEGNGGEGTSEGPVPPCVCNRPAAVNTLGRRRVGFDRIGEAREGSPPGSRLAWWQEGEPQRGRTPRGQEAGLRTCRRSLEGSTLRSRARRQSVACNGRGGWLCGNVQPISRGIKALKVEAQERCQGETDLVGHGGRPGVVLLGAVLEARLAEDVETSGGLRWSLATPPSGTPSLYALKGTERWWVAMCGPWIPVRAGGAWFHP
jgi:hypothetical protein